MASNDDASTSKLPDFPRKTENMTEEEYQVLIKKHYEENGLRLPEDFTEDEKKSIIEDNCVNLIGPKRLSQKYKTSIFAIRKFVWQEKGLNLAPEDLSKFPDFPRKSGNMSRGEYQEIVNKYWKHKKQVKKRSKPRYKDKERKRKMQIRNDRIDQVANHLGPSLEKMIPEDLSDYPDFPEFTEDMSHLEYTGIVEKYWRNRRK